MNIYDISKKAGVSIATVSRVINGNANVSERTRKKVLEIMHECDFTPNIFARGLGLNTMKTVGIMCADSSDPYIASAIFYLEQELRRYNYDALLCCTGYDLEDKQKYINLLLSKRIDAVILVGSNFVEAEASKNDYIIEAAKSIPIIIMNGALSGNNIYCVLCDDYHAVYDATKALQQSGCKKVLYLYNAKSYSGSKKLSGYLDAVEFSEQSINKENYIQLITGSITDIKNQLRLLYQKGLSFDGIIASDDQLAIGALKFARDHQLIVPEQLSIIGYNNSIIAQCCDPELTSVDNKLETVCSSCISTLMGVLKGQEVPLKTVFSAELHKRYTTRF
jgi:Transcriptional regulators